MFCGIFLYTKNCVIDKRNSELQSDNISIYTKKSEFRKYNSRFLPSIL